MALLKLNRKKRAKNKISAPVPIYLTEEQLSYLSLFNYAHGWTRTAVIEDVIQKWIDTNGEKEDELIALTVERTLELWRKQRIKDRTYPIRSFKEEIIYELEWKKLTVEQIRKIIIGFNDGTKEKTRNIVTKYTNGKKK